MAKTIRDALILDPVFSGAFVAQSYIDECSKPLVRVFFNLPHLTLAADLTAGGTERVNLGTPLRSPLQRFARNRKNCDDPHRTHRYYIGHGYGDFIVP